ncbi:Sodium bicarbonate transporter-like protein 11 [Trichuris trichiura]|uniref:Sodium bicarbonate transporter-like protein 11 n=1 Tax=Trichuris trichiura TaxID=36087 RepID=A0A077ZH71_TRITR|nr:Sodium bicarbonate transporter-like protein 11 [Trichuris trichiura]
MKFPILAVLKCNPFLEVGLPLRARIIHEMDIQEPEFTSEQVKNALFTENAGNQFHILTRTVQSICTTSIAGTHDFDQTWICAICVLPTVQHRHVAIARLTHPTNLGRTMQDLRFIIIVIAPSRAKGTKTALETARTFATLFADLDIRQRLVMAPSVEYFRQTMLFAAKELAVEQNQSRDRKLSLHLSNAKQQLVYLFLDESKGVKENFLGRLPHYLSDYADGIRGPKTIQKLLSTVVFLYFACLLPSIAFGVLNHDNTEGHMGVKQSIFAQAMGGLFFSVFGGQPIIVLLTTVPLSIYVKIIYQISREFELEFFALYACVGLWCQLFLVLYAGTELSNIMKWATR